jgi:hypothetical protein
VANPKNISSPVDIFKAHPYDLGRPQTVGRQQHQDGVVAEAGRGEISASHFQHPLHFLRTQRRWDAFVIVNTRANDCAAEIGCGASTAMQMA